MSFFDSLFNRDRNSSRNSSRNNSRNSPNTRNNNSNNNQQTSTNNSNHASNPIAQMFNVDQTNFQNYMTDFSPHNFAQQHFQTHFEQHNRHTQRQSQRQTSNEPVKHPASKKTLDALPVVFLSRGHPCFDRECVICLDELVLDNLLGPKVSVVELPCLHVFHKGCIESWLANNYTCPQCRYPLLTDNQQFNTEVISPEIKARQEFAERQLQKKLSQFKVCRLETVGLCDPDDHDSVERIIRLPKCSHTFHASCLKRSLIINGFDTGDIFVNVRCPMCRVDQKIDSSLIN